MKAKLFATILIFTLKGLTVNGQNYQWAKSIGSVGTDYGRSIAVDGSGNTYITGHFSDTADFDPGAGAANLISDGATDIFFAKYDANGNYIFAKSMGSAVIDAGNSIIVDGSGNVIIAGHFSDTVDFDPGAGIANLISTGLSDLFFAKYDANGNYIFAKSMGSANYDEIKRMAIDTNGNIYITGYILGAADFDPGAGTAILTPVGPSANFFAKYDASGNYIYAKSISASQSYGITTDHSGNIFITGTFTDTVDFDPGAGAANLVSVGDNDIFFAKYDASGNYIFAKSMGGIAHDYSYSIAVDDSFNIYLTGSFQGTTDFDPGAGTANLSPVGINDIFFAKYDNNGNYIYAKNIGSVSSDIGYSIAVDNIGNTYITGTHRDTADFDPGSGTAKLVAVGNYDIFFAHYDGSGNYIFAKSIGSASNDIGLSIAIGGNHSIFISGYFTGAADFNPDTGTALLTHVGLEDIFLAKYEYECNNNSSSSQTITACNSYLWNNNAYTVSGTYMDTIPNSAGCDSVMTLNLTINNSSSSSQTAAACYNYVWNGNNYNVSGTYIDTIPNAVGCDSMMTLNLTINNSSSSSQTVAACYNYAWNGNNYNASGTYIDTIPNAAGCDSVMILNLTINTADTSVIVSDSSLTANVTGAGYQWLDCGNGFAAIPGEMNQTYSPTVNGNYAVMITQSGCTDTSACYDFTLPCPLIFLTFSVTNATPGLNDGAVKVNASGGQPPYLYSLDSVNFQFSSTFAGLDTGTYQVYLTDSNGCTAKGTFIVDPAVSTHVLNPEDDIKFFPNPFSDELTIKIPSSGGDNTCLRIIDVLGKIIYTDCSIKRMEDALVINPSIPEGIYFLEIAYDNNTNVYKIARAKSN